MVISDVFTQSPFPRSQLDLSGNTQSKLMPCGALSGVLTVFLSLVLTACPPLNPPPDRLTLDAIEFSRLPGWGEDSLWAAIPAFLRSCATLQSRETRLPFTVTSPPREKASFPLVPSPTGSHPAKRRGRLRRGTTGRARVFERWFQSYLAANNEEDEGLFTGYYEAELRGSRRPSERYRDAALSPPQ
jgi:membrane-bound lytic murein transglycosylase A